MRSILEKAFVALLNEEHDKAEELFHKFIVERARQIHESNRAGDDYVLDENWNDEITTESYFTEDDLSDLEDGEGEGGEADADGAADMPGEDDLAGDDFGGQDDDGHEAGDEFGAEDSVDDAEGLEADGEIEGEVESTEEKLDNLSDQIEKLTAEFEAMMDAIGDGQDLGGEDDLAGDDDFGGDDVGGDQMDDAGDFGGEMHGDEEDADAVEDDMDGTDEEPAMEGAESDEYDDITESIIDELEKVTVSLDSDGKEVGDGGSITQNKGASIPQKNKDARQGGAPIKMKQDAHKGFERETAPSVETLKPRRNNVKSSDAALSKVSKEGDKSAEINKLSSENGNTKSPLEGR